MRMTLFILPALAAALIVGVRPAGTAEKPWCAQLHDRGGDGGRICGYVSWEQCRATTGLQDGFCLPNPAYWKGLRDALTHPKKHRRDHSSKSSSTV